MQVVFALLSALLWGTGNFGMGFATRRSGTRATVVVGFGSGLITASLLALLLVVLQIHSFRLADLGWGCGAGIAQGAGWLLFVRALSRGPISVAAPVAAVTTTSLLFLQGVIADQHLTVLALA